MLVLGTGSAAAQTLALEECRINAGPAFPSFKARCGELERPLDPERPDGETIGLSVAVIPALALEPLPDPVVPIAGGPGQASTHFYAATSNAFESLRRERDILLVDQRGTGDSAPLTCELDDEVLQGQVPREQTLAATRTCLDSLPHDPRYFTTSVAVQDLEAVRVALGYEAFNLYGISYGTRVAQHYARRFPEATRTVILDGVVPPQLALGPDIAVQAQRALDGVFSRCGEDDACSERFPDIARRFRELETALETATVSVEIGHPVRGEPGIVEFGADEFAAALRLLAYHPTTIALIPLLVDQAASGDFAPLAAQYISVRDSLSDSLAGGMHNAVVCTEDAPFFSGEAVTDEELAATYIGPILKESIETMCSLWPAGVMDPDFKQPLATDIPVLLLSGEVDPITPPRYAELAAVDMDNALLLTGRLQGHGLAPRGCAPDIMQEFVDEASVTDIDTSCMQRVFAMPFFLSYGGPAP